MEKRMLKPIELCDEAISTGINKSKSNSLSVMILGILAGAFIAIGGFGAGMASHSIDNLSIAKLISGAIFPVGLMLVLICGAELFTGNSLMITSFLEKKISIKDLLKNWSLVYFSNLIGALLIVTLIYYSGLLSTSNGALGGYVIKTAAHKGSLSFSKAFASGVLCNFIVCLAVWGAYAAKDIVGKVAIIWFPIMTFVVCGFEHSVANMYYLFIGLFAKTNPLYVQASKLTLDKLSYVDMPHILSNLIPVTLGNIVGGVLLVGTAYWVVYKK